MLCGVHQLLIWYFKFGKTTSLAVNEQNIALNNTENNRYMYTLLLDLKIYFMYIR